MSTNTHVAAVDRQHERIVRPSDDAYGGTDRRILVKSVYDLYSDYVSPVIGRFTSNDDDDGDEDDEDDADTDYGKSLPAKPRSVCGFTDKSL